MSLHVSPYLCHNARKLYISGLSMKIKEMPQSTMSATRVMQSTTKLPKVAPFRGPEPKEGWTFVNLSEPKQSEDKSLRRVVRSNAMRDYCRKERKKTKRVTTHQGELGDPTPPHEVNGSLLPTPVLDDNHGACSISCSHAECVYDCEYSSSRVLSSPIQRLGAGGTDPFDASPMGGDLRYKGYLMNHCELPTTPSSRAYVYLHIHVPANSNMIVTTVIARRIFPMVLGSGEHPLIDVWMPYAVTDPVLFLATLNLAASDLDAVHGRRGNPRTLVQKGETIRLINLRLNSAETVSDSTIGAVLMLTSVEVSRPMSETFLYKPYSASKVVVIAGACCYIPSNSFASTSHRPEIALCFAS